MSVLATSTFDVDAIPAELRELRQWVIWRFEEREGKATKVPYRADGSGRASSIDPTTWNTFPAAVAGASALDANGIGFVFDGDDGFVGVDLDGGLSEADRGAIMAALDSYSEASVSGSGVHVFVRASLNGHGRNRRGPFEVYEKGRYFCVTGAHVRGTPTTIEDRQAELVNVLEQFLPAASTSARIERETMPVDVDDRELLDRAFAAKNGETLRTLYEGAWETRYPSHSEGDLALCRRLAFWTGRDAARIDAIFRRSGLMREKWDERHGETTYGEKTIASAIAGTTEVYTPRTTAPPKPSEAEAVELAATQTTIAIEWMPLSEVEMRSIVFRDKPLLQADAFHLVAGRKGMGKGTLLASIAARVTRGELGENRNVFWIASEDSAAIDLKPRIVAAGGDPARVFVPKTSWLQLPRDTDEISRAMTELGEVGMLVIDPIGNHIAGKDSNSETDIRDAIAPLNKLADEHHSMVFGVRHLSEKECSKGVLAAILGSSAWVQVPRAVLAVVRDNDDPQVSHVQCVAGNRLPAGTPGRMFRISGVRLPKLENDVTLAEWIGDSAKDVETMLGRGSSGKEPSKSAAARELILDVLDSLPKLESDELDARIASETGIAAKTVKNIRGELKNEGLIRTYPDKDADGTVLRWYVSRTLAPRQSPSAP